MFVQKKKLVEHVLAMRENAGSASEDEEEEEDEGDILQVPIERLSKIKQNQLTN